VGGVGSHVHIERLAGYNSKEVAGGGESLAKLDDLRPHAVVRGVLPDAAVTVVSVQWFGSDALELTYKDPSGRVGNVLLYRDDEPRLEVVEAGRPWSFDGDGALFRLVSEAHRIRLAYLFDPLLAVHTSLLEPLPHQITGVYEAMLPRQPLRFLLADDPGAGKTVMAGLLIKELLVRGDVQRCLVVCPGNLVEQWQDELYLRFQLPFEIMTNDKLEAARTGNWFLENDLVIVRLDKTARDESVQAKLSAPECRWDLVVVDEAHKMSATFFGGEVRYTKRYKLGQLLSGLTRHFLLLTATPHNGKEEDFQLFLALLDGDRFEGRFRDGVHQVDVSDLMRRMVKENLVKFDGTPLFPERFAHTVPYRLSDLEARLYVGKELPVIAWIWARTVPSPNPAARGAHVPLMSTFWLSSKKGSEAYLEPVVDRAAGTWRFRVRTGAPADREVVKAGTKTGRARFRCLLTGDPISNEYANEQAERGKLGCRLVATVVNAAHGRTYLPADASQETAARVRAADDELKEPAGGTFAGNAIGLPYGFKQFCDYFTPRQLTAMVTLSDLVREVRTEVRRDALAAGLPEAEANAYADTVLTFLGLAKSKSVDFHNSLSRWSHSSYQPVRGLFGRQAIPMVWDFVEANPLENTTVAWGGVVDKGAESLEAVSVVTLQQGHTRLIDAASPWDDLEGVLVSTDPPYYDNIGYAALSDFFYVWLRRTIGDLYPDLFGTILVPKEPELVAAPERFDGDKRKAKEHFEHGFRRAFAVLREKMDPRFPLTVYYAFKQDDEESGADEETGGNGNAERVDRTTGWETMLTALVETGFQVTATWPVRASQRQRMIAMGTNALASYIVLACRPRPADAPPRPTAAPSWPSSSASCRWPSGASSRGTSPRWTSPRRPLAPAWPSTPATAGFWRRAAGP
jgi:hypothetical protein